MTMVTSPAWGMPAAPMLAAVAVMLQRGGERRRREAGGQAALLGPSLQRGGQNASASGASQTGQESLGSPHQGVLVGTCSCLRPYSPMGPTPGLSRTP